MAPTVVPRRTDMRLSARTLAEWTSLHAGNVLAAAREPWLVIDPKPLIGERAFGLAPIIRGPELGHSRDHVLGRLDRLSDDLAIDRKRARGSAFAQTVAWCFDNGRPLRHHLDVARWLMP